MSPMEAPSTRSPPPPTTGCNFQESDRRPRSGGMGDDRGCGCGAPLSHPDDPDLNFLYGTILTDGNDEWSERPTTNVCVFADRQVDRSPTGSGVTARIAIQRAGDLIPMGLERSFSSIVGSTFTGKAVEETSVGHRRAVIVEVAGEAHFTGESTFTLEDDDPLPAFLVH